MIGSVDRAVSSYLLCQFASGILSLSIRFYLYVNLLIYRFLRFPLVFVSMRMIMSGAVTNITVPVHVRDHSLFFILVVPSGVKSLVK